MSVDIQQLQTDLDTLAAFVTTNVPQLIKLANDLFAEVQALKAGQSTGLDPTKVKADLDAIQAAVKDIPAVLQNDTPTT